MTSLVMPTLQPRDQESSRSQAYEAIFQRERAQAYPVVDALEESLDVAIATPRLEAAARVLACPMKAHPPNWQHGRVLYALTRRYLATATEPVTLLDIGTAKGFSALCLQWAMSDANTVEGQVISVDVIDPLSTAPRNTVADLDGPLTLAQILAPWPEARAIQFVQARGVDWLREHPGRVHVAFVDGKHTGETVATELWLLVARQQTDDLAIVDDVHLPEIRSAMEAARPAYQIEYLHLLPLRGYAIARRR